MRLWGAAENFFVATGKVLVEYYEMARLGRRQAFALVDRKGLAPEGVSYRCWAMLDLNRDGRGGFWCSMLRGGEGWVCGRAR